MAAFGKAQYIKRVEDDRLLTGRPRTQDLPSFSNTLDDSVPAKTNPLGAKGVGELGTVGSTPTVMNAIMDALWPRGVRNVQMPATPQLVWQAIQDACK